MARPRLGLFGALFAIGSVLAWRWAQAQRDAAKRAPRELNRWENEGGKVVPLASAAAPAPAAAASVKPANGSGNGALGGTSDAWHFPRS
jgi:hypothetical protein